MRPIQKAIESLQAKELCPRLHVDVTHDDAVCPDFVREKWKERLVIDLDPNYPLELSFTKLGVEANLSFGGYVTRCTFPWAAIFLVADRETGRGQVFEHNIPASLRHQLGRSANATATIDSKLTEVRDDHGAKSTSRRRKRRRPAKTPGLVVAETETVAEIETETETETAAEVDRPSEPADEAETDEPEVKSRRAAFRVIDGGS